MRMVAQMNPNESRRPRRWLITATVGTAAVLADGWLWRWILDQGIVSRYLSSRTEIQGRVLSDTAWVSFFTLVALVVAGVTVSRWLAGSRLSAKVSVLAATILTTLLVGIIYGRSLMSTSLSFSEMLAGRATIMTTWVVAALVTAHAALLLAASWWWGRKGG